MASAAGQDMATHITASAGSEASTGSKTGTEAGAGAEPKAAGKKSKKSANKKDKHKNTHGDSGTNSASIAAQSTAANASNTSSISQLQSQELRTRTQWCELSGFSRFSSRADVLRPLTHPALILHELHQELDKNLFPTGKWVMLGEVRREEGGAAGWSDEVDADAAGTSTDTDPSVQQREKLPLDILRPRLLEHYSNGHKIQLSIIPHDHVNSNGRQKRKYLLAKDFNITPATLRLHGVSVTAGVEHLKFFFEDFDLSVEHKALERLKSPDPAGPKGASNARFSNQRGSHPTSDVAFSWLVRFQTPTEAERAFFTLDNATLNGTPVQMFRYT